MKRGFEIECKRHRERNTIPPYRVGNTVRLHDGRVVTLTRVVVRDWTTEYWAGTERLGHRAIAKKESRQCGR